MKRALILFCFLLSLGVSAQRDSGKVVNRSADRVALVDDTRPGTWQNLDTAKAPVKLENIYNRPLYSDTLTSSFLIFVKTEVKEHKHAHHAEQIMVLDGEAEMHVDSKSFKIKKGDFIFVPKNTFHSVKVTSKVPLKVVSIQAPHFDGKDRIFKETK